MREVTALHHKARDNAVEAGTLVPEHTLSSPFALTYQIAHGEDETSVSALSSLLITPVIVIDQRTSAKQPKIARGVRELFVKELGRAPLSIELPDNDPKQLNQADNNLDAQPPRRFASDAQVKVHEWWAIRRADLERVCEFHTGVYRHRLFACGVLSTGRIGTLQMATFRLQHRFRIAALTHTGNRFRGSQKRVELDHTGRWRSRPTLASCMRRRLRCVRACSRSLSGGGACWLLTTTCEHTSRASQRLVKCRVRSETEARKAAESTMKRAVHEARELKKELVLLRQEKEELRREQQARTLAVSAPGSKPSDDGAAAAAAAVARATEKKLRQQLVQLTDENAGLREKLEQLASESAAQLRDHSALVVQREQELQKRVRDAAALEDEAKKLRAASDDTKRKYQKMVREKKEDLAKSLQENEHLARCKETLERQLELLPQLKKQLQYAKDKSSGVAEDWQKKLEQRDEAFLRQEEDTKKQLAELRGTIAELEDDKERLHAQLDELTSNVYENEQAHDARHREQADKFDALVTHAKELQTKLLCALDELQDTQRARFEADETLAQEAKLRQMADDAADAVEARALATEKQLEQATQQLAQLEKALTTRGITFDFLLKTPPASGDRSSNNKKELMPPQLETKDKGETPEGASANVVLKQRSVKSTASTTATLAAAKRTIGSAGAGKTSTKALPASLLRSKPAYQHPVPTSGAAVTVKARTTASAAVNGATKRASLSLRSSSTSNNNEVERDGTPERSRRG